ncbi:glycosyltransferase [Lactobacillus delbrueckii subsp. bulgaricus]|nr:hypothetical protein [Lactobacillus delbrueckii subsp. bulgaricus]MBT8899647.1 hypothetical protein [Lactobacillus delbrueckii subsp. bulgaricus]
MPKKIMFLHCSNEYSGAENISLSIAKALKERGFDVVYCSPNGPIRQYINGHFNDIRYLAINNFNLRNIRNAINREKPDIVHAADFRVSMYMALLGKPYVVHLHNNPSWIKRKSLFTGVLLYTLNHSVGNIYVSKSIEKEFVFSKYVRNNTQVIENVVLKDRVLRGAEEKNTKKYDIGFFGRLTEQKDPLRFLKIVKQISDKIPNLSVLMVGKSDGTLDTEIQEYIGENKLNVNVIGFQQNPYKYMKSCRIIIMPSKWEGFGLTAVEAMILGKPVLSTDVGGLKDVQRDTDNICYTDSEFAIKSIDLLTNKKDYVEKSDEVKKAVERFTNIDSYINRIVSVYGYGNQK